MNHCRDFRKYRTYPEGQRPYDYDPTKCPKAQVKIETSSSKFRNEKEFRMTFSTTSLKVNK